MTRVIEQGQSHAALSAADEEVELLAGALGSPRMAAVIIARLTPEHFQRRTHREIFKAIRDVSLRGDADFVTVRHHLEKSGLLDTDAAQFLIDHTGSIVLASKAKWLIGRVLDAYARKCLWVAAMEAAEMALNPEIENPVEKSLGLMMNIRHGGGATDTMKRIDALMGENYQQIEKAMDSVASGRISEVPSCGFYDLDKKVAFTPGALIVLAARPAMGKSALALNMACSVGQERLVSFFSLEMSGRQLAQRLMAGASGVGVYRQQVGSVKADEWPKMAEAVDAFGSPDVWIDDGTVTTVSQMLARCRRLEGECGKKMGLVVVDYLGLVDAEKSNVSETERVGIVSRGLKRMAIELKCSVLALSQLNRNVESRPDKRPNLSDLRQSGAIEQDADAVMFIYRDDYYNPDSDKKRLAEVIVAKNRSGETGTVELYFDAPKLQFHSIGGGE